MRRFFFSGDGWPYLLVPFIPIAVALEISQTLDPAFECGKLPASGLARPLHGR